MTNKNSFKRIMIFGRPGSGKTAFAVKLSNKTGLPLYHLDKYFFIRNWQERETEDFLSLQQNLVDQEEWIIDGNSTKSLPMRYERAELAIYFCYPRLLCLFRLVKRLFHKDKTIDDRAEGCRERISWRLITYMWNFNKNFKNIIGQLQQTYPNVVFYKVTNDEMLTELAAKLNLII